MKKLLFIHLRALEQKSSKEWRRILENPRRLLGIFCKFQLTVFGSLRKGHCLSLRLMSKSVYHLYRKNGALFTAQYLKQVAQLVMWYVGSKGSVVPKPSLKMHMALTRSGIPKFIPPLYRRKLRGEIDPKILKLVLSVCAFYRVMKVGTKGWRRVSRKTIHFANFEISLQCRKYCLILQDMAAKLLWGFVPDYGKVPLDLGFSWKPVFTSGPNTYKRPEKESFLGEGEWIGKWRRAHRYRYKGQWKVPVFSMTPYHTLPMDAIAMITHLSPDLLKLLGGVFYMPRLHQVVDGDSTPVRAYEESRDQFIWLIKTLYDASFKTWLPERSRIPNVPAGPYVMKTRPEVGRFGLKLEGAGKVRVFAIPSPILQCLFRPLHDWAMSILRLIPQDGTYNQLQPLQRLIGLKDLYSFDLKSATDLLPSKLTGSMLVSIFGHELGYVWQKIMNQTAFRSPERLSSPIKAKVYRFTRGQPLGFYSSWPLFTLTHHMLVWIAALEARPNEHFQDYAILGDDIIIADQRVAERYRALMEDIGGIINIDKSLISHNGTCEFAKRFIINNHTEKRTDCSPLSSACMILSFSALSASVFSVLNCSFKDSFRIRGAGYKVLAKLDRSKPCQVFDRLSLRWRRHWLSLHVESGIRPLPLELWLAFPEKGILNCYEMGYCRYLLLQASKPKALKIESFETLKCFYNDVYDKENFNERLLVTLLESWLKHLKWYYLTILEYDHPLLYYTKPPVAPISVDRKSDEHKFITYGVIYKVWDKVRRYSYHIIPSFDMRSSFHVYEIKIFKLKDVMKVIYL